MLDDLITQGSAFYKAGNYAEARKKAEEVLKIDPHNDVGWTLLYLCADATGNQRDEIKIVTQWHEAVPESRLALEKLTLLTIWSIGPISQRKKKALALVESYQSKFPDDLERYQYLRCNYELSHGNKIAAVKIAEDLGQDEAQTSEWLLFRGWINYRADRHGKAHTLASQAISLTPEEPLAWRLMAIAAFRELKFGQARRAAKTALSLDPTTIGMKTIKTASVFGWFPLFFFISFVLLVIYRIAGLLSLPGILKPLTTFAIAVILTHYTIKFVIFITSSWAFDSGAFFIGLAAIILGIVWLIVPDFFLAITEYDQEKKPNSIKLKKY